jgi:amidase
VSVVVFVSVVNFVILAAPQTEKAAAPFTVVEASIADLRAAMEEGRVTSRQITAEYLARIARYQDTLRAALVVNPRALEEAEARDRERAAGLVRGPLHGIPIALKDNIHTTDVPTTGGALAFERYVPPYEATITTLLRAAGAVIVAKTGMTELANWVAGAPTPMPGNYNAVHGFGMNPYDPRADPRLMAGGRPVLTPGGSSSGIGTAASLWAGNVGTETSGSILTPANLTMLVGVKPTVGRVSRYGIIPITADQDTAGPMAKTVRDAAIMLGVLEGDRPDPRDAATGVCPRPPGGDYTSGLSVDGLRGARVGIPRAFYYEPVSVPGQKEPRGGISREQAALMTEAITVLRNAGATVVDPANVPSVVDMDPARNVLLWGPCNGAGQGRADDSGCSIVLKYGMKRDFNRWLASLGSSAPVASLSALRQWNLAHRDNGAIRFGQSNLDISDEMDLERDRARYESDRAKDLLLTATHGIDEVLRAERLDALIFPGSSGSSLAARPGYPTVIVPFGVVPNNAGAALPAGFDAKPQPSGVSFTGGACSEPTLLRLAYAFEQATRRRVPPAATP